jgi:hypothetical protein
MVGDVTPAKSFQLKRKYLKVIGAMFINKESVNFNCVIKWAKSFSSTK